MVMNSTTDEQSRANLVREIFHSFKRAGADIIVSYHARQRWLEIGLIEGFLCKSEVNTLHQEAPTTW